MLSFELREKIRERSERTNPDGTFVYTVREILRELEISRRSYTKYGTRRKREQKENKKRTPKPLEDNSVPKIPVSRKKGRTIVKPKVWNPY